MRSLRKVCCPNGCCSCESCESCPCPTRQCCRESIPAYSLFASLCKCRGSVIPRALFFAVPSACLAVGMKVMIRHGFFGEWWTDFEILSNNGAYTGFNVAMAFLFVFRTSQAYSRFWEGCTTGHRMYAEWLDFAAAIIAFSKYSKAEAHDTHDFHHRLVRLLSLLHASASATLRGLEGAHFEILDIDGLEDEVVERALLSQHPTLLIGQWTIELVMEGVEKKVLTAPPPILSRAFQEFSHGMLAFHEGGKITHTKFPFPYLQLSAIMLLAHWWLTPFIMCQWVKWDSWVFFLTLLQVMVFWCLHFTALEIEYPFKMGQLTETHAAARIQKQYNEQLLILIDSSTRRLPLLSANAETDVVSLRYRAELQDFGERQAETVKKHVATKSSVRSISKTFVDTVLGKPEPGPKLTFKDQLDRHYQEEVIAIRSSSATLGSPSRSTMRDSTNDDVDVESGLPKIREIYRKTGEDVEKTRTDLTGSEGLEGTISCGLARNESATSAWTLRDQGSMAPSSSQRSGSGELKTSIGDLKMNHVRSQRTSDGGSQADYSMESTSRFSVRSDRSTKHHRAVTKTVEFAKVGEGSEKTRGQSPWSFMASMYKVTL